MNFLDINPWEFVIIVAVAFIVIGPERLPEYAAKLGRAVRQLRGMATQATTQLREQMGPEFDDIDWKTYDPRQYDPRRIVRDALSEDSPSAAPVAVEPFAPTTDSFGYTPSMSSYDASRPTPYDVDAT